MFFCATYSLKGLFFICSRLWNHLSPTTAAKKDGCCSSLTLTGLIRFQTNHKVSLVVGTGMGQSDLSLHVSMCGVTLAFSRKTLSRDPLECAIPNCLNMVLIGFAFLGRNIPISALGGTVLFKCPYLKKQNKRKQKEWIKFFFHSD